MITFARGLVLRKGDRSMEFERQIDFGKIQFKYLDNFEVCTFGIGSLYAQILQKKILVIHQNGHKVNLPDNSPFPSDYESSYSLTLSERQEKLIEYRLRYVRAALANGATKGSRKLCAGVIARLAQENGDECPPSPTALLHWLKRFQESGRNPYALMDRRPAARRPKRLSHIVELIIEAMIAKHYLQFRGATAKATSDRIQDEIRARQRLENSILPTPSVRTVLRRINEIDPYVRDYKRYGPAFARNKWRFSLAGDQSTRILERVEIDHTWLDIWVLDPRTGVPIGRPWITVVLDRLSSYPLGIYISFYGPSVASVAHAIKNSIFPKDELIATIPEISTPWKAMGVAELYVIDNGLEFHSQTFKRMAWDLRADLLYNPVRQPWLKASIERVMMEFNRILPLRGKVYTPQKNMKPQDPSEGAAILFDDLCISLIQWAADVFPNKVHPKNLVRPLDIWEEGLTSSPLPIFPLGLERFEITAGVSTERTIDGDGVFFKYMRYNSYELQDYRRSHGDKFRTEVRFNPDNLERMHVLLPKKEEWLAVPLQRPSLEYGSGLSLIQHEIVRKEAQKRLTRVNAEEELIAAQSRLLDRWGNAIAKGVKVRKHSELIRFQGYTSAHVFADRSSETASKREQTPQSSKVFEDKLTEVMPYKSFTLDEEYA